MQKKLVAFACAAACLTAIPFVIDTLASRLGRALDDGHLIRAILYFCVCATLIVTIFGLWLLEGKVQ